jgi:outer membrane lipoprotein-sorting protein
MPREYLLLLALAGAGSAQTEGLNTVPTEAAILARMTQARIDNRAHLRSYTVTRNYRLFGQEKLVAKSEVIADVTFIPPDVKRYAIQHSNGTGIGEKIVRQMLEHETDVVKNSSSTDISPQNYDFRLAGEEDLAGRLCYVLELRPKRKDKNLLRGRIWVDTITYLLQRIEGQPAKVPSWWLRDIRIALVYGEVGGMWLQTSSESTANVRLFGPHTVVSRDLEYSFSELAAADKR